ncbi:YhhN-domain-containing protein [Eremomyces bilateralis CBS 781.70]|uniref:YhhN-domain-containing protein n=1 Tax=Eremomyces bilateralis CBS 781.70 TaxID=1392243 RepID=A0A6G1FSC6_9PEZI|nr:YhhN-domain-containing protein [Eremomyces bilateralis CBS 781.70]KAF1808673.1 YhhN-domain-containing protein [Eremomyces bilateralis CBS 781.70]
MARKTPVPHSAIQPSPDYKDFGTTLQLLRPFLAVSAIDLIGIAVNSIALQWLSKPLLAPVLLILVYVLRENRAIDRVAIGLVLACGGDIALLVGGETAFLVGMGCFLVTQIAFTTAFLRHRSPPVTAFLIYVPCWAVANFLLWTPLGPLAVPVLVYSLALALMAITATGVSSRVALGGGLFLISDMLIGIHVAGVAVPCHGLAVMTTYIAALLLITTGWVDATPGR